MTTPAASVETLAVSVQGPQTNPADQPTTTPTSAVGATPGTVAPGAPAVILPRWFARLNLFLLNHTRHLVILAVFLIFLDGVFVGITKDQKSPPDALFWFVVALFLVICVLIMIPHTVGMYFLLKGVSP